jgi:hypothetical protein
MALVNEENTEVDYKVISHLALVLSLYLLITSCILDLENIVHRSIGFYFFFIMTLCYLGASQSRKMSYETEFTDYEPVFLFCGLLLGLWGAITDIFFIPESTSKFSGVILILGVVSGFGFSVDVGNWIKGRIDVIRYLRTVGFLLYSVLGVALYLLIQGTWEWPYVDLISISSSYLN